MDSERRVLTLEQTGCKVGVSCYMSNATTEVMIEAKLGAPRGWVKDRMDQDQVCGI